MKTWVFLDLDQCARDMQAVDGASCHVVAYCGKAYAGPEPLQGEVMRSCALSREAADALFHYDLGRRVRSGAMDRGDRVCVVSRDASWHNAQYHLAADGFTNVIMCTGAKDMPPDVCKRPADSLSAFLAATGLPKSEKALLNFVRNNVAPDRREEFYSRMTTAK